jgi:hypothetical protein
VPVRGDVFLLKGAMFLPRRAMFLARRRCSSQNGRCSSQNGRCSSATDCFATDLPVAPSALKVGVTARTCSLTVRTSASTDKQAPCHGEDTVWPRTGTLRPYSLRLTEVKHRPEQQRSCYASPLRPHRPVAPCHRAHAGWGAGRRWRSLLVDPVDLGRAPGSEGQSCFSVLSKAFSDKTASSPRTCAE